jgi:hypothetical protein
MQSDKQFMRISKWTHRPASSVIEFVIVAVPVDAIEVFIDIGYT